MSPALGNKAVMQCCTRVFSLEQGLQSQSCLVCLFLWIDVLEQQKAATLLLFGEILVDDLVTRAFISKTLAIFVEQ